MTAVFLPLMTDDLPDTAERVRWAVQSIPFALPEPVQLVQTCTRYKLVQVKQIDTGAKCP